MEIFFAYLPYLGRRIANPPHRKNQTFFGEVISVNQSPAVLAGDLLNPNKLKQSIRIDRWFPWPKLVQLLPDSLERLPEFIALNDILFVQAVVGQAPIIDQDNLVATPAFVSEDILLNPLFPRERVRVRAPLAGEVGCPMKISPASTTGRSM